MEELPLLRFRPILRDYLWGGLRLKTELGKAIGNLERCAESWEVVDHGNDQSIVEGGPLNGAKLHDLVVREGEALFGRNNPQRQFPLLLKFLDCQQTLSVQVHPNDEQGAKLDPPDLGKTEAWIVLAAEPGSKIYAGLKVGVDRSALRQAIERGECDKCLHQFEPRVGDCIFIEAGTVHALGAGLLIAEIQQASDTTFRLFDWNRVDKDGKPRMLHIEQALDVIDFERGPIDPVEPLATSDSNVELLVECDKFTLTRCTLTSDATLPRDARFHILAAVEGCVEIRTNENRQKLKRGETILVPASAASAKMIPHERAVLLDIYLP